MKVSVIVGLVFWAIFIIVGIGGEFLTAEKDSKNVFWKVGLFLGGFFLAGIIFSILGLLGHFVLAPFIEFFGINWWFITIDF